jgi:hypothetical protein
LLAGLGAEGLLAFAAAFVPSLPISCSPQLRHNHRLVKLSYGTQDLTDQHLRCIAIIGGEFISAGRLDYRHAQVTELPKDHFTDEKITSYPVGSLYKDCANAVALDAVEQSSQPVTVGQLCRAADPFVTELFHDDDAAGLGVLLYGLTLTSKTIAKHLAFSRNPKVRKCLHRVSHSQVTTRTDAISEEMTTF